MSAPDEQAALARLLLTTIRDGDNYVELRALNGEGRVIRAWYEDPSLAVEHAHGAYPGLDIYVGAVCRVRRGSDRRALRRHGRHVWADLDSDNAIAALDDFPVEPSFLVESGGLTDGGAPKLHAWWLLHEGLLLPALEHVNRRLALALGSDPAVIDAARILRLPGTTNQKTGRPAQMVRVGDDCSVFDLLTTLPELPPVQPKRKRRRLAWRRPLCALPATEYVPTLSGREVGRDGKLLCPFHGERTPSLHVYDGERGWYCFGCRRGGDVYTFAGLLWGMDTQRQLHELHVRLVYALGVAR